MNYQLLNRLGEASKGHIAVNGDQGPNLFADAEKELERLYEIENLVQSLFEPIARNGASYNYRPTTEQAIQDRLEVGRKLGVAVGKIKPNDGEASK